MGSLASGKYAFPDGAEKTSTVFTDGLFRYGFQAIGNGSQLGNIYTSMCAQSFDDASRAVHEREAERKDSQMHDLDQDHCGA